MEKICEYCGKTFDVSNTKHGRSKRFCGASCSAKWRVGKYGIPQKSEEAKAKASKRLHDRWQDLDFRAKKIQAMKDHNPVYMDGVIEKAHRTRLKNGSYTNNFKYGNGKLSEHEEKVKALVEHHGFYYNYAIPTKIARDAFPQDNFSVNYKPDFVNLATKLCIEVDGNNHTKKEQIELDKKKEKCLSYLGFTIVRFTHEQIDNGDFEKWLNSYLNDN